MFALATLISSAIILYGALGRSPGGFKLILFLFILPALCVGITAAVFGPRIADPERTSTPFQGGMRGTGIFLAGHLIYGSFGLIAILFIRPYSGLAIVIATALLLCTVPTSLLGGGAGWLLYRIARKPSAPAEPAAMQDRQPH